MLIVKLFPMLLTYGMVIHESYGLSLSSCLIDIGNSIFTHWQSYIPSSRVINLNYLHMINLDPNSVTAYNKS